MSYYTPLLCLNKSRQNMTVEGGKTTWWSELVVIKDISRIKTVANKLLALQYLRPLLRHVSCWWYLDIS